MDGKQPRFVSIPGTKGTIALWHFPSKEQLKQAKLLGCTHIVTLQSESENITLVQKGCDKLGMEWVHCDFWKMFLPTEKNKVILTLADELIQRLKEGANILIHCAAGVHRTGTLSYIIMRRLGLNPKDGYEFLGVLRPATRLHVGDSRIETAERQFSKWFNSTSTDEQHNHHQPNRVVDHSTTRRDQLICSEIDNL